MSVIHAASPGTCENQPAGWNQRPSGKGCPAPAGGDEASAQNLLARKTIPHEAQAQVHTGDSFVSEDASTQDEKHQEDDHEKHQEDDHHQKGHHKKKHHKKKKAAMTEKASQGQEQ